MATTSSLMAATSASAAAARPAAASSSRAATARFAAAPKPVGGARLLVAGTARLGMAPFRRLACRASTEPQKQMGDMSGIATDENVPEGHKGLHGFLYGEGGAEAHDGGDATYSARKDDDDGESILPLDHWMSSREGEKPVGVYGIYDSDRELQYVGFSRNVVSSIKGHMSRVSEKCCYVRFMVFANKSMATRKNLEKEAQNWIDANGTTPAGNGADKGLWEAGMVVDRAEYEEKKLKLRKAMGENLHDDVDGETPDAKQRRLNLLKAVEGDDWSGEIDAQTRATIDGDAAGPVVSPFTNPGVHRDLGEDGEQWDMTMETVDKALDEVRPYLIADGGNVEVVFIDKGVVALRLQGACGTCPSSTATMKMGIETSLKARFGDQLVSVVQVEKKDTSASVGAINEHLDMLRSAIENYGGKVEVVSVEGEVCEIKYKGPPPIRMGVESAIKDKFPDIRKVNVTDLEE